MPDNHVCYDCLLGQAEPQTLRALHGLMQQRRVVQLMLQEGTKKLSEIAASLSMSRSLHIQAQSLTLLPRAQPVRCREHRRQSS